MSSSIVNFLPLLLFSLATMSVNAGDPDHFILTQLSTIVMSRMDPIVNPGSVSGHVHSVVGASNFNMDLNSPSVQQQASCSSAIIGADRSNYWSPTLMYQYPNGSFAPVLGGSRIYYFTKSTKVVPFPPGLRMLTGSALTRDLSNPQSQGLLISCDHGLQTSWLPNATSHPGGCSSISLGIYFPSCGWANQSLDSPDHFSHMAWPVDSGGGESWIDPNGASCPDSHPIKYPTIFFESNYYLADHQPWRNDPNLLVLSHGDTTGNNFHADFVNGWDPTTLKETIEQCGYGKGPQDQLQNCAPLARSMNYTAMLECRFEGKIVDEDIGLYRPVDKLPGCNPLWTADMEKKPTCSPAPEVPGLTDPDVEYNDLALATHIPVALNFSFNADTLSETYIPSLGAAKLLPWGSDGSDKSALVVGSVDDILDNQAGGATGIPPPALNPGTTSATTAKSSPTGAELVGIPNGAASSSVTKVTSSTSRASSVPATTSGSGKKGKSCKRRRRDLPRALAGLPVNATRDIKVHQSRRSRKGIWNH